MKSALLFSSSNVNNSNVKKIYLYCPYEYKDRAKKLGAKFDGLEKQWYVMDNDPNKEILINTFHSDNFNYRGYMENELLTLDEVAHRKMLMKEFENIAITKYKNKFKNADDDDVGRWYCENYNIFTINIRSITRIDFNNIRI
jgi:hypothetical protein